MSICFHGLRKVIQQPGAMCVCVIILDGLASHLPLAQCLFFDGAEHRLALGGLSSVWTETILWVEISLYSVHVTGPSSSQIPSTRSLFPQECWLVFT